MNADEVPQFCSEAISEINTFVVEGSGYDERSGYVQPPSTPIRGIAQAVARARDEETMENLEDFRHNMEDARHNRGMLHSARARAREAGLGP